MNFLRQSVVVFAKCQYSTTFRCITNKPYCTLFINNSLYKNQIVKHQRTVAFGISTIVLGVQNSDLKKSETTTESAITTTSTPPTPDMSKYRLPTAIKPNAYDLFLYPDLKTGLFKGKVVIDASIKDNANEVVLHSYKLNITNVTIDGAPANREIDEHYQLLTLRRQDGGTLIKDNNVIIEIEYDGDMKDRIVGLYTSSYNGKNGVKQIATSKFEPTYARQAFPCFDEPNMKAKYKVHLLKPNETEYNALSNYPVESTTQHKDGILVNFEETVQMSTYLSCFIVSDFEYTEFKFSNNGTDVPFRVYASPGQSNKTRYAGNIGKGAIEYYVDYFGLPYPLPKLDMVAIPDFVSGAMEHWGLVTYRETALLYTDETHSNANKQRVATVIAHELAHSWFGNLVTMDWWNNLWLNEGFASYIEYKGVNACEPSWDMMTQFITDDLHPVLNLDAKQSSHPIIQTVVTPDQITEVFDTISYNKGASILRMLENAVGDDNFKNGITNYLNTNKFGNAVSQNLWDELQKVVGDSIDVTTFMNTFTEQMGYPILEAKYNSANSTYTLTQKRFLIAEDSATVSRPSKYEYKWTVPLRYITNDTESEVTWFNYTDNEVQIKKPDNVKWFKFNPSQVGYYRVNYEESEWENLISHYEELSIADKTHLIEESFSIAESGQLKYTIPLDLTQKLENEIHYIPWKIASSKLQKVIKYFTNTEYETKFMNYVNGLLKVAYRTYTWDESKDEEHLIKLGRVQVLSLACAMNLEEALTESKKLFESWLKGEDQSPNLRSIIYKYGMRSATAEQWDKALEKYKEETDANEKLKILNGLANVQNPTLLYKLLELALNESFVRRQDYFSCLQYIASNSIGTPIVWDYVRNNWSELVKIFTVNDRYLGRLIPAITSSFTTEIKLKEMKYFFEENPEAGAGVAARKEAIENLENNILWLSKYKQTVQDWLDKIKTV